MAASQLQPISLTASDESRRLWNAQFASYTALALSGTFAGFR